MHISCAHVVVAMVCPVSVGVVVVMLFEIHAVFLTTDAEHRSEGMWLRNLCGGFQIVCLADQQEFLAASVRPERGHRRHIAGQRSSFSSQAEHWRYAFFKDRQCEHARGRVDVLHFLAMRMRVAKSGCVVIVSVGVTMVMTVAMAVTTVVATAQQPGACDIHQQTDDRNRDRLAKVNRHR